MGSGAPAGCSIGVRMAWGVDAGLALRPGDVGNALEGGTARAIEDIERTIGDGWVPRRWLEFAPRNGLVAASVLRSAADRVSFAEWLSWTSCSPCWTWPPPELVLAHQLLGFPTAVITALRDWLAEVQVRWAEHDGRRRRRRMLTGRMISIRSARA